jgi:hypothetical protein
MDSTYKCNTITGTTGVQPADVTLLPNVGSDFSRFTLIADGTPAVPSNRDAYKPLGLWGEATNTVPMHF